MGNFRVDHTADTHDAGPAAAPDLLDEVRELRRQLALKQQELTAATERHKDLAHRIRNEFQQIGSLLRLQKRKFASTDGCSVCLARLGGFIELHDMLEQKTSGKIRMDVYLAKMAHILEHAFGNSHSFEVSVDEAIELDVGQASVVGLILSEAATNAVKHGFNGRAGGHVGIDLSRRDGELELRIADNGSGFDRHAVTKGTGSLLLEGLVGQLDGTHEYADVDTGACLRIRFPSPFVVTVSPKTHRLFGLTRSAR